MPAGVSPGGVGPTAREDEAGEAGEAGEVDRVGAPYTRSAMSIEPQITPDAEGVVPDADLDAADEVAVGGLWAPERRPLVVGLVLTITLVAFEALAIATVMPTVKDDLGGLTLYGWVFSGFFLGSLLGIVVAGQLADRHGLLLPYAAGLGLFAVGLVIGGAAQSMFVLVVGRCLQGFGAGAIPATAYVAVARGIPSPLRPRMFAVTSTAWVVPAAIGPAAALGLEHVLSWRAVFLVLVPLVVVAGVLTAPALRQLGPPEVEPGGAGVPADAATTTHRDADAGPDGDAVPAAAGARRHDSDAARLRLVIVLVVAVGMVFAAGSGPPVALAVALVVVGVPVAAYCVLHLLPAGTMRLAPGIPATVALRGLLTFAFFSADAFVTLTVTDGRGKAEWIGGAALALCTFCWTAASWVQERVIARLGPRRLDQIGFVVLIASLVAMIAVAQGAPIALTVVAWGAGGFAIGLAYAPQAVTVLALAPPGQEGATSAAIQLSDGLGIALGTGIAGGVVALADQAGWSVARGVTGVFLLALVVAVIGLLASARLPDRVPAQVT